ncbi:melanopsin-like, partial [Convolutriloba macropyga]|uniref:melanopsin-like n=1 Tax=Convolutriloba macropyga TaxID=536237 RepID=UPI003F51DDFF
MRRPHNVLVVNLAVADLVMVLGSQLPTCLSAFWAREWMFGATACTVSAFLATTSGFASIGTMGMIAYDRFCRLSHPLRTLDRERFGNRRSLRLLAGVWLYSLSLSLPPLTYHGYGAP